MKREPEGIQEEKHFDEEAEEMELNDSVQMMLLINNLLDEMGEDTVHAQDWAMLCPHQEEFLYDVFFVEDISLERALAMLRALVNSALHHDHC